MKKEKYYIKYYDSYKNGYNATLGGESRNTIIIDEDIIVKHYLQTKSCRETAKYFKIDKESVALRVKSAGYKLYTSREQQSKNYIVTFPNGVKKYFHSFPHIAEYLLEINYPIKSKKVESIRKGLSRAFRNNTEYYKLKISKE